MSSTSQPAGAPPHGAAGTPEHDCRQAAADPTGRSAAYVCDRLGTPQLWLAAPDEPEPRLLDPGPDPVAAVSWSPDGRWIAYTAAPGGGEHTVVRCVRPDGTGRHDVAGADTLAAAHFGCWTRDGAALAVTEAVAAETVAPPLGPADAAAVGAIAPPPGPGDRLAAEPAWAETVGQGPGQGWVGPLAAETVGQGPGRVDRLAAETVGPPWGTADGGGVATPRPSGMSAAGPAEPPGTEAVPPLARQGVLVASLVDPDGRRPPRRVALEAGSATLRVCDISADGRWILLRRGPRGHREAVVVDAADGRETCLLPAADGDPWIGRFSPDGHVLWLRSDEDREYAALLAVELTPDGSHGEIRSVTARDDADLELFAADGTGKRAALAWNHRGRSILQTAELGADGTLSAVHDVPLPHEVATRADADAAGGWLLSLSGSVRRSGVWRASAAGAVTRTAWTSPEPAPPGPVPPRLLELQARDGTPLTGWFHRAPGRPGPGPCVVHLHGGPESQERPVLDPLYQALLARGLHVFAPDVRGSSGHGRAFLAADRGAGRVSAVDDVADCAAHLVDAGLADPDRLAVMGRSYGGYLVMAALVRHPDLFRAGVAVSGMSDLATFFAGTEPWIAESAAVKYGHPVHDHDLLALLSPMTHVDALRTPVLAVHGALDTNVPPGESEQFVRAARRRGVPAELLLFDDEGHDLARRANRERFYRAAGDWLTRWTR